MKSGDHGSSTTGSKPRAFQSFSEMLKEKKRQKSMSSEKVQTPASGHHTQSAFTKQNHTKKSRRHAIQQDAHAGNSNSNGPRPLQRF